MSNNFKIIELHYYDIWNHYGKCVQISTNMLGIGLEMFDILRIEFWEKQNDFVWMVKPMGACKVLKTLLAVGSD